MPSFFFRELQLITIHDSYMSWSTWFATLKLCVGFSIFDSVSFLLKSIFLFYKIGMDSLTLKHHNSFQNQSIRKTTHSFAPRPLISKLQKVLKFNDICVSWSPPKTELETNFLNLENWSFKCVTFSQIFDIPYVITYLFF